DLLDRLGDRAEAGIGEFQDGELGHGRKDGEQGPVPQGAGTTVYPRRACNPWPDLGYSRPTCPGKIRWIAAMLKRLLAVTAAMLLTFAAAALAVDRREDHPTTYVVKRGDTLWDIAGRFLEKPWLWPEIWQANPQVQNPHLIFPGQVLSLVYIDGEPRIRADGPQVGEAVDTIPLSEIEALLKHFTVVEDPKALPYVIGTEDDRLYGVAGQLIYVRGLQGAAPGMVVDLARPVNLFGGGNNRNPPGATPLDHRGDRHHSHWTVPAGFGEATGENLGYELAIHATGEVTRVQGEVATVVLREEGREI